MVSNYFTNKLNSTGDSINIILMLEDSDIKKNLTELKIKVPKKLLDDYEGTAKQIVSFYDREKLVILVGLGIKEEINKEKLDKIFNTLKSFIHNLNLNKTNIFILPPDLLEKEDINMLEQLVFQIDRINYKFCQYKTNNSKKSKKVRLDKNSKNSLKSKKKNKLDNKYYIYDSKKVRMNKKHFTTMSHSLKLVRDLGNEPANVLNPLEYVKRIKDRGIKSGFKVKVLDSKKLEKLGLYSLLSVSSGSKWNGYLVEITLPKSKKNKYQVCLVGKGITFDSGGISLKRSHNMGEMKTDMLGSATVLGVMDYLALTKSDKNVVGYLAIAENMPDAEATRPGDIVKSYNGKTIEILNTDAEGRLVLADAITYAQKHQKPEIIIDYATLTGQQENISCSLFSSLMTHDKELERSIVESGENTQEKIVAFPIYEEFVEHTESQIADVKNSDFKCKAGMIQAGAFLSNFVSEKVRWAHLDIAGPAILNNDITGVGVRLTVDFLNKNL